MGKPPEFGYWPVERKSAKEIKKMYRPWWCCPKCGECVGLLGRIFFFLHKWMNPVEALQKHCEQFNCNCKRGEERCEYAKGEGDCGIKYPLEWEVG